MDNPLGDYEAKRRASVSLDLRDPVRDTCPHVCTLRRQDKPMYNGLVLYTPLRVLGMLCRVLKVALVRMCKVQLGVVHAAVSQGQR